MEHYLTPNNVAIEMLRTSDLVELAGIMGIKDDNAPSYFNLLKPLFRVVELANKNDLRTQFGTTINDIIYGSGFLHTVANDFYFSPNAKPLYADADGVNIFGRANSSSLVLATRGMRFDFEIDAEDYKRYENVTIKRVPHVIVNEEEEETTVDTTEEDAAAFADVTVVAGIITADANGNGLMDDPAKDRLNDVTVVIENTSTGERQIVRTVGGFYRFDAKRGETYTLTVEAANYERKQTTITASAFVNLADFALGKK